MSGLVGEKIDLDPEELQKRLEFLPQEFDELRQVLDEQPLGSVWFDGVEGPIIAVHAPEIAPLAYQIEWFDPIEDQELEKLEEIYGFVVPHHYRNYFSLFNGLNYYELHLYGFGHTITEDGPMVCRTHRRPLDITSANQDWCVGYDCSYPDEFFFGTRLDLEDKLVGYFLRPDGSVFSRKQSDEETGALLQEWQSLQDCFSEILPLAREEAVIMREEIVAAKGNDQISTIQKIRNFFSKTFK